MTVTEFREAFAGLTPHGWLDEGEALLLVDYASRVPGPRLEVGSYFGRSAMLLGRLGPLICVDPWLEEFCKPLSVKEVMDAFKANVRGLPVTWIKKRVEDWEAYQEYFFTYLDGDHSFQGTANQIGAALKVGAKIIAVHDVNDSGGGVQVRDACLKMLGPWKERVNRLAVWERS